MGMPYGSIPRKTVPRAEEEKAMDFSVLWDFEVQTLVSMRFHFVTIEPVSGVRPSQSSISPLRNGGAIGTISRGTQPDCPRGFSLSFISSGDPRETS